jgi:hypothetical protein
MIDEDELSGAMHAAADEFEISQDAKNRILAAARKCEPGRRGIPVPEYLRHQSRGRQFLSVAAVFIVLAAISIPLFRGEIIPSKNKVAVSGSGFLRPPTDNNTGLALKSASPAPAKSPTGEQGVTVTAAGATSHGAAVLSPKIESTGSVDLTVKKGQVNASLTQLGGLATGDGGFVLSTQANARSHGNGNFSSGTIVLEVPQRVFTKFVSQVQRVGLATSILTSSSDVTSQYVNLRARISALDASRQQYLAIMARATSISGILAVQNQLDNIQSQIEQYQGQLNVLNHATTFGTLTVALSQKGAPAHVTHHRSGLSKAWHDGVDGFIAGFEWLIRLAGPVLFAALFLGFLLVAARWTRRAVRRRRI